MALDIVDLRSFYGSPLGKVAERFVGEVIRARFDNCVGQSVMGIGYATPYLDRFRGEALRVLAFMPATQGVVNWPASGLSASALAEPTMMPLPDSCIDRVIVVHALEIAEHPRELLAEIWRILTPGGRMIAVAPRRAGLWARLDTTPFGNGQPYSLQSNARSHARRSVLADALDRSALCPALRRADLLAFRRALRTRWGKARPARRRRAHRRSDETTLSAGRRAARSSPAALAAGAGRAPGRHRAELRIGAVNRL